MSLRYAFGSTWHLDCDAPGCRASVRHVCSRVMVETDRRRHLRALAAQEAGWTWVVQVGPDFGVLDLCQQHAREEREGRLDN